MESKVKWGGGALGAGEKRWCEEGEEKGGDEKGGDEGVLHFEMTETVKIVFHKNDRIYPINTSNLNFLLAT